MYTYPKQFKKPLEVKQFEADVDQIGTVCDLENWYISEEWSRIFLGHLKTLESLAVKGCPWAQYNAGNIYLIGYIYSNQNELEKNYKHDVEKATNWLLKCAKQGFVAAVDNLLSSGVGEEVERLRALARKVEKENPETIGQWEQNPSIPVYYPSFCEKVWLLAYGKET